MGRKIRIADNIRVLRRQRGYTARELTKALAEQGYYCSLSLVKNWESGYRQPTLEGLAALCDTLNVSADDLIFADLGAK